MPMTLQPTPRRIHRTRESFPLGYPVALVLPPGTAPAVEAALRELLGELFPELPPEGAEGSRVLRFSLLAAEEDVPAAARSEAFRLQVGSEAIEIAAGSAAAWRLAARALGGLREGDALHGVELLDWPSFPARQLDLPWPGESLSEAALALCLALAANGRFNRLGIAPSPEESELPAAVREEALRLCIELVRPSAHPAFRLMEYPVLFPAYSHRLPALREAAQAAESTGASSLEISLGEVGPRSSLEAFAYGTLFAGDCAWNPRKADLKAFRRGFPVRRYGFESRALVQAVDELEAGAAEFEGADPTVGTGVETAAPFEGERLAGLLRPHERAAALGQRAGAALAALAPLQPDTPERAAALQGLQWTAQRLRALSRRLGTEERVRELYRGAFVAAGSPKAVSDRLLKAADFLESEAGALEEHRAEWHALWRRERASEYDPATEASLRAQVEALRARAARVRDLRNRYIQTGGLPSPAAEGLELSGIQLTAGIVPTRLPPQPSPAWWPEGGAARLRLELECPEAAAGMVWAVQADFRALAGESGAFNVRSARLLPLTESDEAGPEQPCQLLRGGFAFIPDAGSQTYFLYLDPEPGPDAGLREVRASQSRAGVRLENRHLRVRLAPTGGFVIGLRLLEREIELLPPEEELEEGVEASSEWRLRVLETGPLLARARAEHPDGRIRQVDLGAGHWWLEISANAPWTEFLLPDRAEVWGDQAAALIEENGEARRFPLRETASEVTETRWAAQHGADGLTLAALAPDAPVHAAVACDGIRLWGRPHGGRVLLFSGFEADPAAALTKLLAAQAQPPRVRLGVVEERRVREF